MRHLRVFSFHVDLLLCALVAFVAMLLVALDANGLVRVLIGIPLVLFLPGYALISGFFPTQVIPAVERLLIAVGASIAISLLAGLVLAVVGVRLTPNSWTVTLAAVTLVGLIVAWLRRVHYGVAGPGLGIATMPRISAFFVLVAALLALNILAGSRVASVAQSSLPPTQLWMVPVADKPGEAQLGVRNGGDAGDYVLRLSSRGQTVHEFDLTLAAGQVWATLVTLPADVASDAVVARLFQAGSDTELRFVVLEPPTNGG